MRLKILFIGHSYHELTKSSEFFIDYLKAFGEVSTEHDESWKLKETADSRLMIQSFDIVVVWQLPGVITDLADSGHTNLVYVPMYDAVHKIGGLFWKRLRKVKIICFSPTLRATCLTYGLHSYFIQYYPETSKAADIGYATNRLFFWQRRPFPNWQTLTSILPVSQFEKIHHHIAIDPGISNSPESAITPTPSEIQQKNFSQSIWFEKKADLIATLNKFNLFFLPREREGIGFSFLDAMANGMVPIGFNFPTYSEYVIDGINGFIVDKNQRMDLPQLASIASNMRHYLQKGRINYQRSLEGLESFLFTPLPPTKLQGFAPFRKFTPKIYRYWLKRKNAREIQEVRATRNCFQGDVPLITVVTVVRNNAPGLAKTFQSVFSQTFDNFEYIVVDGNSTDETLRVIKLHESSIDSHLSEKDTGPYDAMMKGARLAKGRYVIYMNAGDEFAEITSLEDAMESCPEDAEFIYGHYYYSETNRLIKLKLTSEKVMTYQKNQSENENPALHSRSLYHHSSIVAKDVILKIGFGPTFVITVNHAFTHASCGQGAKTYHTNTVISKYGSGSFSGTGRIPNIP
jgi:Glycosyl transferase family 2/Glycosyl transferases group 1